MRTSDTIRHWASVLHRLWTQDIWRSDSPDEAWSVRFAKLVARSVYIVATGFSGERIKLRAASLTYTTLLSLVPALAVAFSLFAAFGGLEDSGSRLKEVIADALAVSHRDTVVSYLDSFVGSAGKLGSLGTVFLVVTVVMLLTNIESAFNDIWGVRRPRTVLQRFQVYWPLVTLGPLISGLSISMTAAVETSDQIIRLSLYLPSVRLLLGVGPLLLLCSFFTFAYIVMPNTKVRVRCALVGGVVAGVLWTIAQKLFTIYAANAITYSAIYGSLGVIPLFVIWLYISWTVTLLGSTLTYAVQNVRTFEPDRPVSQTEREFVAVRLMAAVADHFARGSGALTAQALLDQVRVPPRLARTVLGYLQQCGLLHETTGDDMGYVPGRPLADISVADVIVALREEGKVETVRHDEDALSTITTETLEASRRTLEEELGQVKLTDLAERANKELGKAAEVHTLESGDKRTAPG